MATHNMSYSSDDIMTILKIVGAAFSILGIGGLIPFVRPILEKIWLYYERTALEKGLSSDLFNRPIIENSLRYYVEPNGQNIYPMGREDFRGDVAVRGLLYVNVDDALKHPTEYKYIILLADSGMGKTSFLLNYYARNIRNRHRKYEAALLPLGIADVDERIVAIPDKEKTILLLDAFDEDTKAITDYHERLHELVQSTQDFFKVLISCRTQFFPSDHEIPRETGVMKFGPRQAGKSGDHCFHKIYISPFSDEHVEKYLRKRYPFGKRSQRKKAQELIDRIPNLVVRPMLLAHIQDLVDKNVAVQTTTELYEEMVSAWLIREEGVFPELKAKPLRKFSERVAFNIYINRRERKAERISVAEISTLARQWDIPLEDWQLTGRSLLNRNADGEYKFAHRSIMEYLVVKHLMDFEQITEFFLEKKEEFTDQMKVFYQEMNKLDLNIPEKHQKLRDVLNYRAEKSPQKRFKLLDELPGLIQNFPHSKINDIEFCLIPGGPFYMGSTDSDAKEHLNEKLTNEYWLSRYPVTVGQYKQFLDQSGHKPTDKDCIKDPDNRPVRFITWHEARQFGEWLTALARSNGWISDQQIIQLPSEAEWEKAARGGLTIPANPVIEPLTSIKLKAAEVVEYKDNPWPRRVYPWGDEPDSNKANYDATGIGTTSPVGCFPDGASPYGCEEMNGNVWEWTRSIYQKYPYDPADGRESLASTDSRVLRGGAFLNSGNLMRSANRDDYDPHNHRYDIGFRVCLSPIFNSGS